MATRSLNVLITGDQRSLDKTLKASTSSLQKFSRDTERYSKHASKQFMAVGTAAKAGLVGLAGGSAAAMAKQIVGAASDINESLTKNRVLFGKYAKSVDDFSKRSAASFGISRTAALKYTGVFGNLFRSMGVGRRESAKFSTGLTKLAADMASFNNTSIEDALEAIRSGLVGESEPLRKFGVNINETALKAQALSSGLVKANVDQAKMKSSTLALDIAQRKLGVTLKEHGAGSLQAKQAQLALENAQQRVTKTAGGQSIVLTAQQKAMAAMQLTIKQTSAAHGDFQRTSGGLANQQRILQARLSDTAGQLGAKLLPAALAAVKGINSLLSHSREAGDGIRSAWRTSVDAVRGFLRRNREDIQSVGHAVRNVATAAKAVIDNVLIPAFKILLPAIKGVVDGILTSLRGLIRFVSGVLTGDWRKAWQGVKDIVSGALHAIVSLVKGAGKLLLAAAEGAGKGIAKGIIAGLGNLGHLILDKLKAAISWVTGKAGGLASGIGKVLGIGDGVGRSFRSLPRGGGGSLMGAQPALAPFAAIGSRFGLSVSSGRRPGAITTSGNVSYHSSGEAIDEAGSPTGMMGFFRYMKSHFGGRLAELIYGPGRVGIKNGQPYNFGSALNAQHMDHVHVAFDTGRPGVGDGLGRRRGTGDGLGQLESLWMRAGGPRSEAAMAAAVAMAESGGRPGASHRNSDGSIDRGLWQINSTHGSLSTFDRLGNAKAAVRISKYGGSWAPWSVYKSGTYRKYLDQAREALKGIGAHGKPVQPVHGVSHAGGGVRQPTAGTPSEDIYGFLHPRPLKGGGPSKGFLEGERPPAGDDGVDANTAAIEENNRLLAAQNDLNQQIAANQLKLIAIAGQGDQIVNAVIATVNSGLGRSIGLGQAGLRSPAGSVAGL